MTTEEPLPEMLARARTIWSAECIHNKARAINCTQCLALAFGEVWREAQEAAVEIALTHANRWTDGPLRSDARAATAVSIAQDIRAVPKPEGKPKETR